MHSIEQNVTRDSVYYFHTPTETAKSLFLYPVVLGEFEYLPGYSLSRNRYDSFLFLFVEDGSMEILLDRDEYLAWQGDVVFLNCYQPHAYRTSTGCKALWVHFDGTLAAGYYEHLTREQGNLLSVPDPGAVRSRLAALLRDFETHTGQNEARLSLILNNLLLELCSLKPRQETSMQEGIQKVVTYITQHFRNEITLEELAKLAGFSPYHFTRVFKKETGATPHQFLLSTRIAAAKYNLSHTGMTIREIANACGFEDESAFCSQFKKRVGCTPGTFRTMAL